MKYSQILVLLGLLLGCQPAAPDAQTIVNRAIAAHGGSHYDSLKLEFDFRNVHYQAQRQAGVFNYFREWVDSTGRVQDRLGNNGFERRINDVTVTLPEDQIADYSSSVNSVHYFALLPYGLNDAAVRKTYSGKSQINGQNYHRIQVTFSPKGGGEDYTDEFLYWINAETYTVDYLAYSFAEKEGAGFRFRQAINPRTVGGIRFQDYINFKPITPNVSLPELEDLYINGKLEEVSRIELENIEVKAP